MANKQDASPRISANGGNGVLHTPSKDKDNHFLEIDCRWEFVKEQDKKLRDEFSKHILTRFQAKRLTGIDTSSICPFVARQKRRNAIWSCGRRKDPYTGHYAEFLTMNRAMAVDYYKDETEDLWRDLPETGKQSIFKSIDAYLDRKDLGVFISSSLDDDTVREVWLKVQERIDSQMAEINTANEKRRMSIYCNL